MACPEGHRVHLNGTPVRKIKKAIPRVDRCAAVRAIESSRLLCASARLCHLVSKVALRAGKNHLCFGLVAHPLNMPPDSAFPGRLPALKWPMQRGWRIIIAVALETSAGFFEREGGPADMFAWLR